MNSIVANHIAAKILKGRGKLSKKKFKILTVKDAAYLTKCCEETVYRATRNGKLKHVKVEDRIFISDYALKDWQENRRITITRDTLNKARELLENKIGGAK